MRRAVKAAVGRETGDRVHLAQVLRELLAGTAGTGQAFFDGLVQCLGRALGARYVFVGELSPDAESIRTRSYAAAGRLQPSTHYVLRGTPCANVVGGRLCYYRSAVQALFPSDPLLTELEVDSYLGVPLRSSTGEALGILVAMHDGPLAGGVDPEVVLQVFAARAAAELERGRHEREAGANEERLRLALDAARMGAWEFDLVTQRLAWSERENLVCGFPPGTRVRTFEDYLERIHEEDRTQIREAVVGALEGRRDPRILDHRVVQPDGSLRWIEARGQAFLDETGRPLRLAGTIADVTERKLTEGRLRASEERWRRLSESAFEGIGISQNGRILDVNAQLAGLLGYQPEELVGRSVLDLIAPESAAEVGRRLTSQSPDPYEHLALRKDGSLVPVEVRGRTFSLADQELRITVVRDLSQSKRLEASLEAAAREWHDCFDALPIGLLLVDGSGTVRRANRRALEWSQRGRFVDLIGRPVGSLGSGEPWGTLALLARLKGRAFGGPQSEVRDAMSGLAWSVSAHELGQGPDGQARTILLFADVTETARLREALVKQEALAAMGSLVAGVAHEVRTPLFSISATVDAFEGGSPEELAEGGELLRAQVRRLSQLMSDLLDYGRPPSPQLQAGLLSPVLQRSVQLCRAQAEEAGVALCLDLPDELPLVQRDASRLEQALQNLIANAIQHAPRGSRVTVVTRGLRRDGLELVEVRVEDEGPGVPPECLPRLFEPFYSRRKGGSGLGLSIVQRIVDAHGGEVRAANRAAGGAAFTVLLPAAPTAPARG